jgi:hypothetical protein
MRPSLTRNSSRMPRRGSRARRQAARSTRSRPVILTRAGLWNVWTVSLAYLLPVGLFGCHASDTTQFGDRSVATTVCTTARHPGSDKTNSPPQPPPSKAAAQPDEMRSNLRTIGKWLALAAALDRDPATGKLMIGVQILIWWT